MKIHKSAEDYLEMILMLDEKKGYVRSVDIATGLGVSKPSVSVAMKRLREDGYITMDKDNYIALTEILIRIGVDPEVAQADACKVEHDISPQTYDAIVRQLSKQD